MTYFQLKKDWLNATWAYDYTCCRTTALTTAVLDHTSMPFESDYRLRDIRNVPIKCPLTALLNGFNLRNDWPGHLYYSVKCTELMLDNACEQGIPSKCLAPPSKSETKNTNNI
jgi:hypothetical protein